jgi:hypothetical protein
LAKPYKIFCQLRPTYAKIAALRKDCPGLDEVPTRLIIKHFEAPDQIADLLMERMPEARPKLMV